MRSHSSEAATRIQCRPLYGSVGWPLRHRSVPKSRGSRDRQRGNDLSDDTGRTHLRRLSGRTRLSAQLCEEDNLERHRLDGRTGAQVEGQGRFQNGGKEPSIFDERLHSGERRHRGTGRLLNYDGDG